MKTIFRNIFLVVTIISSLLLTACGGGGGGGGNPAAPTQTGTLQGTVTLPEASVRHNINENTDLDNLRASQNYKGTKVWLESNPDITALTDSNGKYTITGVPFGKNRVVANLKVGETEYKWRSDIQEVANTKIVVVPQIVMQKSNTSITGCVVDAMTGNPIQGVIVEVWGQRSTSGSDGVYTVYNMPAGSWDVTYSAKGYESITTPISFAEGVESKGNFYMYPEGSKPGEVDPLQNAWIEPYLNAENIMLNSTIKINLSGADIDFSKAKISFTSGNPDKIGGKFAKSDDCIIYTHNKNWPKNTVITGTIDGLINNFNKSPASFSFSFKTRRFEGSGTENDPYLVYTDEDLNNVRYENWAFFKQMKDIDLSNYGTSYDNGKGWLPINNLNNQLSGWHGTYDGNNHKITNLYINRPNEPIGLFGLLYGDIKNLGISISENGIKGGWGGAMAAYLHDKSEYNNEPFEITGCYVDGSGKAIFTGDSNIDFDQTTACGSLFGHASRNYGTISNCYATIPVEGKDHVGGLIGYTSGWLRLNNCYSKGNIKGNYYVGGLVGRSYGQINNSYSEGNVDGYDFVGGLVGGSILFRKKDKFDYDTSFSFSIGDVSGHDFVGGFSGSFGSECKKDLPAKVNCCFAVGKVTGNNNVGGFAGGPFEGEGSLFFCNSYCNVDIIGNEYVGGFISIPFSDSNYINSYCNGNISGKSYVGGFIGDIGGNVGQPTFPSPLKNCVAYIIKISTDTNASRLVYNYSYSEGDYNKIFIDVTNCYAKKDMTLVKKGASSQPGLANPLLETFASDNYDGANLLDNPDWKNEIFKDGYENGESFDSVWEIGTSGLPILKNMPGNPAQ